MAKYTVIAEIGRAIVDMLKDNLVPEPVSKPENIGLCDPKERGSFVVGVHPYNVVESREIVMNRPITLPDGCIQDPPTSYQVFYMLSISSKVEIANRAEDEQRILGRILQIFKDNTVLPTKYMPDSLKAANESININMMPMELEEKVKVWSMFTEPYKLSVFFSVGTVVIESTHIRVPSKRVATVEIEDKQRK